MAWTTDQKQITIESSVERAVYRARVADGTEYARNKHGNVYYEMTVRLRYRQWSDVEGVQDHYFANAAGTFAVNIYEDDGGYNTYTMRYTGKPSWTVDKNKVYVVTIPLRAVVTL